MNLQGLGGITLQMNHTVTAMYRILKTDGYLRFQITSPLLPVKIISVKITPIKIILIKIFLIEPIFFT